MAVPWQEWQEWQEWQQSPISVPWQEWQEWQEWQQSPISVEHMALNKTDIRDRRRKLVAEIMVRRPRVTQRQIRRTLTERGHKNPGTGKPWSIGTINRDVEAIRERAREKMDRDAREWRARELDMLRQLQADAWEEGDYRTVVSISKRRAKLLGLDEPEEIEATVGTDPETIETLLDALEDYPEARQAAAEALDKDGR